MHRLLRISVVCLGVLLLTLFMGWRRYAGPRTEAVIGDAIVARSLARGEGFSTPVRHPQAVAVLMERGWKLDAVGNVPDIYHEPLHPLLLASGLKALGPQARERIFRTPLPGTPMELPAYKGDYYLLAVNAVVFWAVLLAAWLLALRLFNGMAAGLAVAALLVSAGMWDALLRVDTSLLLALLFLLLLHTLLALDGTRGRRVTLACGAGAGLLTGLIFLTSHPAVLPALAMVTGYAFLQRTFDGRRTCLLVAAVALVLVSAPWIARNMALTGRPLALAGQSIALVDDDPGANPALAMGTLSPTLPGINLRKTTGKALETAGELVAGDLWRGGAYLLLPLFIVGVLYPFRNEAAVPAHRAALLALAVALLTLPVLSAGAEAHALGTWMAPLAAVFGAAFLLVLIEGTAERQPWQVKALLGAVVALHAVPLLHGLLSPARLPFTYPPYAPSLFALTRHELMDRRPSTYAMMCDVPCGLAWYADTRVWQQPARYADFARIQNLQFTPVHLITPRTLNRPFFSELTRDDDDPAGWDGIYVGLPTRQIPFHHPFRRVIRLQDNMFVLSD